MDIQKGNTAEVFEIVNCDGRCGIIYEKIAGLPMWEHMQNECLFEKFIAEHKKLLDISTDVLMSYKDFLIAIYHQKCYSIYIKMCDNQMEQHSERNVVKTLEELEKLADG